MEAVELTNQETLLRVPMILGINPATHNCKPIIDARNTVIIGISPFNSYFSEENILKLATWANESFDNFYLFIPDVPSKYTLMALGYEEKKAIKKAKKQGNWYNNKTRKSLEVLGFNDDKILNWKYLSENLDYIQLLEKYESMYSTNEYFKSKCLEAAKWVLQDKTEITNEKLEIAAKYFIAELPLFFNSNKIVGTSSSSFCYHSCPDFVSEVLGFDPFGIVSPNQAFGIIDQLEG